MHIRSKKQVCLLKQPTQQATPNKQTFSRDNKQSQDHSAHLQQQLCRSAQLQSPCEHACSFCSSQLYLHSVCSSASCCCRSDHALPNQTAIEYVMQAQEYLTINILRTRSMHQARTILVQEASGLYVSDPGGTHTLKRLSAA